MKNGNKIKQAFAVVSITLAVLIIMSFISFEYLFERIDFKIHNVDLISDIKTEPAEDQEY